VANLQNALNQPMVARPHAHGYTGQRIWIGMTKHAWRARTVARLAAAMGVGRRIGGALASTEAQTFRVVSRRRPGSGGTRQVGAMDPTRGAWASGWVQVGSSRRERLPGGPGLTVGKKDWQVGPRSKNRNFPDFQSFSNKHRNSNLA
jgi:hypothetical protein